jgi:hypothetical protein
LRCFGELPEEVRKELYERFWESLPIEHQQFLTRHASDPQYAPPAGYVPRQ